MDNEIRNPLLKKYKKEDQSSISLYLEQLDDKERKACEIAYNHLGSSFNLVKSNGYIKWKKTN